MNMEDDILIVDDEIPNLQLLTELLEKEGYQVRPAEKAQTALDSALAKPPGLILLDVRMPEMDGFELCRRLKQDKRTKHVPIIFVSALQDIQARIQGFEAGGVDFISKPFQELEILARVRTHMHLYRMQKHLEQLVDERTSELSESKASLEDTVRKLLESEERYELAVAGSAAGIWDWDLITDKVHYSDRLKQLLGYAPDELLDRKDEFWNQLHPDDYEAARLAVENHLKKHVPYNIDFRFQTKSGEYRWFHARGQALWDKTGKATRMSGSITDITERKQAEEGLQQSKEFNQSVLMSLPEHIAVLDREGNILTVNQSWIQFARENDANSLDGVGSGVNYLKICREASDSGDETVVEALDGIRSVLDGSSELFELEYPCDSPTEKRWFLMTVTPFQGQKGGVIVAHINITSRKRAEEEMRKSEERFRSLIEQSPLAMVILTPDGQITDANPAWYRQWGLNREEAAEVFANYNLLTDRQHQESGVAPLIDRAFAGEHVVLPPVEYIGNRTLHELGLENIEANTVWMQTYYYSVKDHNGDIAYVVAANVDITERKQAEMELRRAYEEIKQLKDQLEAESAYLQEEIKLEHNFENIIGQSEALKYVLHRVEQVSITDSPVLIMGETGTGKELMARALHELSPNGKRALVKVNCAALPGELIESELFGREKGAFTGATTTQLGRFELAKGSTLFLDEIGELPLELQAKLLRVLESGEFERLGSSRTLHSDARIIAVTNRVLEEEVHKGRFREDLWYRLKVFPITVPPLREHPEDIPLLLKWFVDQLTRKMGKRVTEIPKRTMQELQSYAWPGNVRELKHAVEGALITAQGKKLNFELPQIGDTALSDLKSFEEMERDYILQALKAKNWRIGGENSAASTLGMHVNTLRGRMKKLGIKRPKPQ